MAQIVAQARNRRASSEAHRHKGDPPLWFAAPQDASPRLLSGAIACPPAVLLLRNLVLHCRRNEGHQLWLQAQHDAPRPDRGCTLDGYKIL